MKIFWKMECRLQLLAMMIGILFFSLLSFSPYFFFTHGDDFFLLLDGHIHHHGFSDDKSHHALLP